MTTVNDPLGDRMKLYEELPETKLMPCLPTLARIDGRNFHTFCQGLKKPYDQRLSGVMQAMTIYLV